MYTHSGVKIIGDVPMRFPTPTLPALADAPTVLLTAVFAMFVGFMESIAVAKTYALANKYGTLLLCVCVSECVCACACVCTGMCACMHVCVRVSIA